MTKRNILLCGLVAFVMMSSSCILDPGKTPPGGGTDKPPQVIEPLTTRAAVLNNIEVSYNTRNIESYTKLLDPGFTFFLSTGDVNNGLPVQWSYQDEIDTNTGLFDPNHDPNTNPGPQCLKIDMTLDYDHKDPSNIGWQTVIPDNYPDETWYTTTIFYSFQIDVVEPDDADHKFISPSAAKAQFTVRNVGTAEKPQWRLIEFRDLGASS